MTKQQTQFSKAVALAKQLQKKQPSLKYTDAVKKAFAQLKRKKVGAAKSSSHKDTKSHNVNIRVVSGTSNLTAKSFTRINNDVNGNPRYVFHWTAIADSYGQALALAKKFGGRKFHNKQYGGGIAIQSYNIDESAKRINEIVNKKVGAVKIIQKGENKNSKVTKTLMQVRTKKGTFKGYKRVSGIGYSLNKRGQLI